MQIPAKKNTAKPASSGFWMTGHTVNHIFHSNKPPNPKEVVLHKAAPYFRLLQNLQIQFVLWKVDFQPALDLILHRSELFLYSPAAVHCNSQFHIQLKCSKELDDGYPSKSNKKDPETIAKLVLEGRYVFPYIPQGLVWVDQYQLNAASLQVCC